MFQLQIVVVPLDRLQFVSLQDVGAMFRKEVQEVMEMVHDIVACVRKKDIRHALAPRLKAAKAADSVRSSKLPSLPSETRFYGSVMLMREVLPQLDVFTAVFVQGDLRSKYQGDPAFQVRLLGWRCCIIIACD